MLKENTGLITREMLESLHKALVPFTFLKSRLNFNMQLFEVMLCEVSTKRTHVLWRVFVNIFLPAL